MTNISQEMVDTYQKEGVVFVKGLFAKQVEILRAGIARNMAEPGPHAAENLLKGEAGRFLMIIVTGNAYPSFKRR